MRRVALRRLSVGLNLGPDLTFGRSRDSLTSRTLSKNHVHSTRNMWRCQSSSSSTSSKENPATRICYRVAASYSGKGQNFDPDTNVFNFNPFNRLRPPQSGHRSVRRRKSNRPASGQDAFFISRYGQGNGVAFGVADGVGGWEESGIDSADFSHGLCDQMAKVASEVEISNNSKFSLAKDVLQRGYEEISKDRSIPGGGSTACVGVAKEDGTLNVANLGDSGFVHLRSNAVQFYSDPQTHAFNTPYQLSVVPPRILAQARMFGATPSHDMPRDADIIYRSAQHGDVLVFATDGLWDNMTSQDVLGLVSRHMIDFQAWVPSKEGIVVGERFSQIAQSHGANQGQTVTLPSILASTIVKEAKLASLDTRRDGPFAKAVQRYFPIERYHGGKIDDICVVVVVVVDQQQKPDRSL